MIKALVFAPLVILFACSEATDQRSDKAASSASQSADRTKLRLVGGSVATPGQFPSSLYWSYAYDPDKRISGECSGSRIGNNLILTATHCVMGRTRNFLNESGQLEDIGDAISGWPIYVTHDVRLENNSWRRDPTKKYTVKDIFFPAGFRERCAAYLNTHPSAYVCDLGFIETDVAIIKTVEPLRGGPITAVNTTDPVQVGDHVTLVGYGSRKIVLKWNIYQARRDIIDEAFHVEIRESSRPPPNDRSVILSTDDDPAFDLQKFTTNPVIENTSQGAVSKERYFTTECSISNIEAHPCTDGGDSGSPLYRRSANGGLEIVGVHVAGGRGFSSNYNTRLAIDTFRNMLAEAKDPEPQSALHFAVTTSAHRESRVMAAELDTAESHFAEWRKFWLHVWVKSSASRANSPQEMEVDIDLSGFESLKTVKSALFSGAVTPPSPMATIKGSVDESAISRDEFVLLYSFRLQTRLGFFPDFATRLAYLEPATVQPRIVNARLAGSPTSFDADVASLQIAPMMFDINQDGQVSRADVQICNEFKGKGFDQLNALSYRCDFNRDRRIGAGEVRRLSKKVGSRR